MGTLSKATTRPLVSAGVLIGIGMGGFVDGILFHQILQIHNMLSNRVLRDTLVNEQVNMFWDGLFHAFTWVSVAVGLRLLSGSLDLSTALLVLLLRGLEAPRKR